MKYIDADKLIAEIEKRQKEARHNEEIAFSDGEEIYWRGNGDSLELVVELIASLQQEQQEKSKKDCNDCPHCVDRKDQYGWHFNGCFGGPYKGKFIAEIDECPLKQEQSEVDLDVDIQMEWDSFNKHLAQYGEESEEVVWLNRFEFEEITRNFYELGLNARKED